uniref:Leucine rich repeat containing 9 n=1 Tax=Hucho hucho TaxID=62062 RepID=A0A4W5RBH2_9TELE
MLANGKLYEHFQMLCIANGVSYEKIPQEGSSITALEVFFSGYPRMVGLSLFPRLCQLTLVGQSISHIKGLESCPLLREFWVVECQLTDISGLQNCHQLQKLYLYDNQISKIENLESLVNLQVLWLNNNFITHIEGLNTLQKLRELNLADNNIEKIGHSLDPNISIENLNLSGNKICSFKELTFLAPLTCLRELGLKDPQSSPTPVCLLCNYATHVLYHMPGLQRLDTYDVSSKHLKDAAESTVIKKMMYYNMRVRTAQRNLAETQANLLENKRNLLQLPEDRIRALNYALKNLECELSEVQAVCRKSARTWEDGLSPLSEGSGDRSDTLLSIGTKMMKCESRVFLTCFCRIESWYQRDLAQATNRNEMMVYFLLMELETVGNIRFEEGCSTDPWFTSCYDLLLSRFCAWDYKAHGITGIKINRIIRIHNRSLRIRFEDKLHTLLASEESTMFSQNYKRWLEYLFYVSDPERTSEKNEMLHIPEDGFKTADITTHFLLVTMEWKQPAKVNIFLFHLLVDKPETSIQIERPCSSKIHSGCDCSLRQSQWFVFDRELVLPEYLIDFEYITQPAFPEPSSRGTDDPPPNDINLDEETLNMEPMLKPRPKLLSLDEKTLLNVARANVLSQITVLNLHGNSLSKLKEISRLTALRRLTISFNEFTQLDDISHMPNLEFVDASYNHLLTLEGLRGLGRLNQLDLRWNQLTRAREETAVLRKHAPTLLRLDTRHNPWHRVKPHTLTPALTLVYLTHLDDMLVTEEEAGAAVQMAAGSRINQVSLLAHSRTDSERPRSLSLLSAAQLLDQLSPSPWDITGDLEQGWTTKITALNLDSQRLSRLTNLDKLVNLRWASFNDNDISKVEGLDNCQHLEELSLNDNCISRLDGVSKLHQLTKLSVNGNQLSYLDGTVLDRMPNLHFLSVENNCIGSLNGVHRARSLFELYIGNNIITHTRDIYHLKALTNLIILDLYGNPLVEKLESYRIYVVFHLPSLKALDGVAVEMTECENAKDVFGGRLTPDMVAEKLGHSNYSDIVDLNLQSSAVRSLSIVMVDLAPADLFHNMRSVNLEHNNLTSFSGLVYLPNIKALCLNYNHIESILPRQKAQAPLTNRQILYHKVNSSGYGQQGSSKGSRYQHLEPLMGSLEVLHLSHNGISNMANLQLSRLTNLKALFLQDNEISQVEGLEGLHQLRELVLDRNRIKALGENSFFGLAFLLELHLAENRLRELNHLQPLTELRRLFLGMNKLQVPLLQQSSSVLQLQVIALSGNTEPFIFLPSLIELSVVGNPVSIYLFFLPMSVTTLYVYQKLQLLQSSKGSVNFITPMTV